MLEVAQAVFAAEGLRVPIDEIARRAKLGVGTLYRHFPTKEALFQAIVLDRIEAMLREARALANAAEPGGAFFDFLSRLVEEGMKKRDFMDVLAETGFDVERVAGDARREFRRALAKLLTRAQRAGAVRKDVNVSDVLALVAGVHVAVRRVGDVRSSKRLITVVRDGLRAP